MGSHAHSLGTLFIRGIYMVGNLFFAIELSIFVLLNALYCAKLFHNEFKNSDKAEILGCGFVSSFLNSFFSYALMFTFVENLYSTNQIVFWLFFFAISSLSVRIAIKVSKILIKFLEVKCYENVDKK